MKGPMCDECSAYNKVKNKVKTYYKVVNVSSKIYDKKVIFIYENTDGVNVLQDIANKFESDEIEIIAVPITHCLKTLAKNAVLTCWKSPQFVKIKEYFNNSLIILVGTKVLKPFIYVINDSTITPDDIPQNTLIKFHNSFIFYTGTFLQLMYNNNFYNAVFDAVKTWNKIISNSDSEQTFAESVQILNRRNPLDHSSNIITNQVEVIDNLSKIIDSNVPVVFDLETLNTFERDLALEFWHEKSRPILFSFAVDSKKSYVLFLDDELFNTNKNTIMIAKQLLHKLFTSQNRLFINHNIKFDISFMFTYLKLEPELLVRNNIRLIDTKFLARLYNSDGTAYSLGTLAVQYLNYASWKDTLNKWFTYYYDHKITGDYDVNHEIVNEFLIYSGLDSIITYELYEFFMNNLNDKLRRLADIFSRIEVGLEQIILNGNRINYKLLEDFGKVTSQQIEAAEARLREIIFNVTGNERYAKEFNLNSQQQISNFLVGHCGLSRALHYKEFATEKEKQLKISRGIIPKLISTLNITGEIAEFLELLVKHSEARKQYTAYYAPYSNVAKLSKFDEDGNFFMHPSIDTAGTVTGRLSTANPNTQQLPRTGFVRRLFIPRYKNGYILSIDYSQAEVRMLALVTQDPNLLRVFAEDRDPYKDVATVIFNKPYDEVTKEERNACKPILLAAIYGKSPKSFAADLNITVEDAKQRYNKFLGKYTKIKEYHDFLYKTILKYGYIYFASYRRRQFDFIVRAINEGQPRYKIEDLVRRVWTKIINAPIQGATSDLALYNFNRLNTAVIENNVQAKWILTVHDSMVFDVASIDDAKRIVELAGQILIDLHPLIYEYMDEHFGKNQWQSVKMAFDAEIGRNYGKYDPEENPDGVRDFFEYIEGDVVNG